MEGGVRWEREYGDWQNDGIEEGINEIVKNHETEDTQRDRKAT